MKQEVARWEGEVEEWEAVVESPYGYPVLARMTKKEGARGVENEKIEVFLLEYFT